MAVARERLRQAGISRADLDARLIAEHLLDWDTAHFLTSAGEPEPDGFAAPYDALVARRVGREPIAYILGRQHFWDLAFDVTPDVLIPRPETELIVEAAIERVGGRDDRTLVADVGTGCGCVAVALARELPRATIVATDVSGAALAVAARNVARHGVRSSVRLVCADLLDALSGPFDLIVANPPYVQTGDRPGLQPEVREHEPAVALFGGTQGLDVVARLVAQAPARLKAGASLIFEFGFGQEMEVERLISETPGLTMVGLRRDLQGIARTAVARREP